MSMSSFGTISYAILGLFYAVLSLLLLTSWRGRHLGGYLIVACTVSAVWASMLAAQVSGVRFPDVAIFSLEIIRSGAWLTFLIMLVKRLGVGRGILYLMHAVWLGVLSAGLLLWFTKDYFDHVVSMGTVLIPGGLLVALAGLILIEQLYRNSPSESRWGVKALALGLGGLFAYDLFLYSQGLLFGVLDSTTWLARGAVNILFLPPIVLAARRNADWELNIFVSRQVVFYTTSLFAVGLYLLLMSVGGYALVIYGGTWGGLAQTVFLVGAGLVLILLLFSNVLRSRFKVFLSKHFFHNKYDYRDEWLRLISTLSGFQDSSTRQIVIKALAQIAASPSGLLWVLNDERSSYVLVASYKHDDYVVDIPVNDPLVNFIRKEGWLVDLEEFKSNPKLYGVLELPDWLAADAEAWIIVPLVTRQELLGLVMLTKAPGPPKLNYEDRDLLKTVGNHIAVHLAQEKADNSLAEAQQFDAYNRLTAFLMHDLSNLIAQQTLIVKNAEKHKRNPDFVDDAMQTIANSVKRMNRVMEQLRRGEADRLVKPTELRFIVSTAIDRCAGREPVPVLLLNGVDAVLEVDPEQFTMVLTHLIKNAQDATPAGGTVSVSTEQVNGEVSVCVSDTGSGMSAKFVRERLFRPFDSTKGSRGMGIGAYQAREFVRKMGGDLEVQSEIGSGTRITMSLPVA